MNPYLWSGVAALWICVITGFVAVRRVMIWGKTLRLTDPPSSKRPRGLRPVVFGIVPAAVALSTIVPLTDEMSTATSLAWAACVIPVTILIDSAIVAIVALSTTRRLLVAEDEDVAQILRRFRGLCSDGMYSESVQLIRDALVRYPDNADLCIRGATTFLPDDRNDPVAATESRELAHRAVALAPRRPRILLQAAAVMCDLHEYVDARRIVDRAARQLSDGDPLHVDLVHVDRLVIAGECQDRSAE
jgi:hypothetical protein